MEDTGQFGGSREAARREGKTSGDSRRDNLSEEPDWKGILCAAGGVGLAQE